MTEDDGGVDSAHIIAVCITCASRFDALLESLYCPRCRVAGIERAFKPIDPLRTALGMGLDAQAWEQDKMEGHHGPYPKGEIMLPSGEYGRWVETSKNRWHFEVTEEEAQANESLPGNMKLPKSEAGQRYELQRMFRL